MRFRVSRNAGIVARLSYRLAFGRVIPAANRRRNTPGTPILDEGESGYESFDGRAQTFRLVGGIQRIGAGGRWPGRRRCRQR